MPRFKKTGDWDKAAKLLPALPGRVQDAMQKAVLQEAHFFRKKILSEFQAGAPVSGTWPPHAAMTTAVRQLLGNTKSKLLIQSADLRNSIGVIPIPGGGAFVGVRRSASSKSKLGVVNLGMIQEGGASIVVHMTDRMRRLLFAAIRKAGTGTARPAPRPKSTGASDHLIKIRIPPRPFLGPVFDMYGDPGATKASILARMGILLGGDLGTAGKPRE